MVCQRRDDCSFARHGQSVEATSDHETSYALVDVNPSRRLLTTENCRIIGDEQLLDEVKGNCRGIKQAINDRHILGLTAVLIK